MLRAIVTGGTSFIGRRLIEKLLETYDEIYTIAREDSINLQLLPESIKLKVIYGDVRGIGELIKSIPKCDVFYHLAWGGTRGSERSDVNIQTLNIESSIKCLWAAEELGCEKFIFTGSQAEYGVCNKIISEETLCHPITEYGKAKLEFYHRAKELEKQLNLMYIHTRIFSIYGEGDQINSLVSQCVNSFSNNQELALSSCKQMWNFMNVGDCVEALVQLSQIELPVGDNNIFNIASLDTRVLIEFVEEIYEILGDRGSYKLGDQTGISLRPDINKLLMFTKWKPSISFKEGILTIVKKYEKYSRP